jgi:hypothetical protein
MVVILFMNNEKGKKDWFMYLQKRSRCVSKSRARKQVAILPTVQLLSKS